jgi:hypothetical protein
MPPFTLENLTALNAAIATGAKEVYYGDKRVVYRSLAEMLQTRALMSAQLNPGTPQRKNPIFDKGL